jgi:bZIP transcription factor
MHLPETEATEDPDGDDMNPGGEGGAGVSRALKQTRRAAQNRAAQRAFRERREKYVKELEKRSEVRFRRARAQAA